MILKDRETDIENHNANPLILLLSPNGDPLEWITWEACSYYYAKDKVLWASGTHDVILRGGTNAITGKQSIMTMDTIVAVKSDSFNGKHLKLSPTLSNKTLFERDLDLCAYCGGKYRKSLLTRDHVHPTSKGGQDIWMNCVTACRTCNQWKADRTPEEAEMPLLYTPYVPSRHEFLLLQNRRILACQMEFLMKGISKNSRVHSMLLN